MKGFLLLGDFVSLVTTCVEDKTAAWALNLNLQSSFKVEIASGAAAVSSSNDLKLLFYGPHARDSCKVTHASAFQFRKSALFPSQTLVFFFCAAGVGCSHPPSRSSCSHALVKVCDKTIFTTNYNSKSNKISKNVQRALERLVG